MITGIKHMAIAVRDVDGALKQYENVLGVSGVTRHEFEKARSSEAHFMLGAIQYQLCRSWGASGCIEEGLVELSSGGAGEGTELLPEDVA